MQQSPRWLQWDAPNSPPKLPFLLDDHHPYLIHPSLNRFHSPSQTASGSAQPFCHSTLSGPTDTQTQTNRWSRRMLYFNTAYARYTDRQRHANNIVFGFSGWKKNKKTSHMGTLRHVHRAAIWTVGHKSKKADESRCVCRWRVLCPNISKFDQEL